jgi:hypothetical protein
MRRPARLVQNPVASARRPWEVSRRPPKGIAAISEETSGASASLDSGVPPVPATETCTGVLKAIGVDVVQRRPLSVLSKGIYELKSGTLRSTEMPMRSKLLFRNTAGLASPNMREPPSVPIP